MENDKISLESEPAMARSGSPDSLSSEIDMQDEQDFDKNSIDSDEKSISRSETAGSATNLVASPSQNLLNGQNGAKNKKLFPQKLWDLINDERYNFCLRWSEDGQLVYLNRDEFEDSYLKTPENQFHTQKAISFVRQMNMYGFRKVDDCYYENDNFKRDAEHLLKNMNRKHPNKNGNNPGLPAYLYQQGANMPSSLNNTPLNNSSLNAVLLDCHQRSTLPYQDKSKLSAALNQPNGNGLNQQQVAATDRLNDDSVSSAGDYCCSVGSIHSENLAANAINQLDLMNDSADDNLRQSRKRQQQHPYFYPQLGPNLFDQFRPVKNIPVGTQAIATNVTNNLFHNQLGVNPIFSSLLGGNFNEHFKNTSINNETMVNSAPFYYDKVGSAAGNLINQNGAQNKSSNHQDSNVSFNNSPVNADFNSTDMSAIYALISSIHNYYQSPSLHHQNVDQNSTCEPLSNLQQLYQQMMLSNCHLSTTPSLVADQSNGWKPQPKDGVPSDAAVNYSQSQNKPRVTSPKSLLFKSKPSTSPSKSASKLSEIPTCAEVSVKSPIASRDLATKCRNGRSSPTLQHRETKINRSFKRSVDSILDPNNNPNAIKEQEASVKRLKLQNISELETENVETTSYARALVTRIALLKESNIDEDVIEEASKYTERFVETLLDTAQVIARHSYGSSSSSSDPIYNHEIVGKCPINETKASNDKVEERFFINSNDLTSALKLLPLKLLKILQ